MFNFLTSKEEAYIICSIEILKNAFKRTLKLSEERK